MPQQLASRGRRLKSGCRRYERPYENVFAYPMTLCRLLPVRDTKHGSRSIAAPHSIAERILGTVQQVSSRTYFQRFFNRL